MESPPINAMLVEDNPGDARLVREMLRAIPTVRLHHVDRLGVALDHVATHAVDIVLLDLGLPDSQGLDTLRALSAAAPQVPVVVLTGNDDDMLGQEAVRSGAQDYFAKSRVVEYALNRAICYAIERNQARGRLSHLNLVLRAIRNVNQLIVREKDPERLIEQAAALLVETRGYLGTWIALGEEGKAPWAFASAGFGDAMALFSAALRAGRTPPCWPRARVDDEGLVVVDRGGTCGGCPLEDAASCGTAIVCALRHGDQCYGFLGIAVPPGISVDEEERSLVLEVSGDLAFALHTHETERQRRASEERYRLLAENVSDVIWTTGLDLRLTYVSPSQERLCGFTAAETLGQTIDQLLAPASVEGARQALAEELQAEARGGADPHRTRLLELEQRRKDGSTGWVDVRVGFLRDASGTPIGLVGVTRDATERRRLQASLAQSDRLASMGMLAAGVAHEINNPLSYVLFNLQSLGEDMPRLVAAMTRCHAELNARLGAEQAAAMLADDGALFGPDMFSDTIERLRDALEGANRIKAIARGLGTFSRVERAELVPVALQQPIEHACTMAYNEIKYRARLVKDFGPTAAVLASEGRLAQVFLNLIINAAHAIAEGDAEHNEIRIRTFTADGHVCAEVSDTGAGIAPEVRDHIFEPFFSTKGQGMGSGLGLAICRNLVTSFGGTISVASEVGKGARFLVQLPVMPHDWEVRDEAAAAATAAGVAPTVRGRILVVDDEPGLRSAIRRLLSHEHVVVTVESGEDGRAVLERDRAFDLLFLDLMMPRMSGMDLHEWLAGRDPALAQQVVFMTGGAFTPRASEYLAKVGNLRIEKPFDGASLRRMAAELVVAAKAKRRG